MTTTNDSLSVLGYGNLGGFGSSQMLSPTDMQAFSKVFYNTPNTNNPAFRAGYQNLLTSDSTSQTQQNPQVTDSTSVPNLTNSEIQEYSKLLQSQETQTASSGVFTTILTLGALGTIGGLGICFCKGKNPIKLAGKGLEWLTEKAKNLWGKGKDLCNKATSAVKDKAKS